jgi:hypothetical protein
VRYKLIFIFLLLVALVAVLTYRGRSPLIKANTFEVPIVRLARGEEVSSQMQDLIIIRDPVPGAAPAEVPSSFDVSSAGILAIADEEGRKLVLYDSRGKVFKHILLPFAPGRVRFFTPNTMEVKDDLSSDVFSVTMDGLIGKLDTTPLPFNLKDDLSRVDQVDSTHFRATLVRGKNPTLFEHKPTQGELLYVGLLQIEGDSAYFDVQTGTLASQAAIERRVCRYLQRGKFVGCVGPLIAPYYGFPQDELRVISHTVFQMLPGPKSVQFKTWRWSD